MLYWYVGGGIALLICPDGGSSYFIRGEAGTLRKALIELWYLAANGPMPSAESQRLFDTVLALMKGAAADKLGKIDSEMLDEQLPKALQER